MSRVSVIIPAFNAAAFIGDTLESVLTQTYQNLEILVIDDGSQDDTIQIVKAKPDPRIRILSGRQSGAAAARNKGLEAATGDLIQFLDADDILSATKIEHQVNAISSESSPSIATCAWQHFTDRIPDQRPVEQSVWRVEDAISWMQNSLTGGGMMQTACWLIQRSVADAVGPWNESLSLHDDGEYFNRVLLQSQRQRFVPDCCVYYRIVDNSLSRRRNDRAIESAYRVCGLRAEQILAVDQSPKTRKALATLYAGFIYEFDAQAPELSRAAEQKINDLGQQPDNCLGGRVFRRLHATFGWRAAMSIRNSARRIRQA